MDPAQQRRRRQEKTLFIVWGPPIRGARSRVLARELEVPVRFVFLLRSQSRFSLPFRYLYQCALTLYLLFRFRPRVIFVQSPPHVAVCVVYCFSRLTGARYVVDAHGAAFQVRIWSRPRWLACLLSREALRTIVTNAQDASTVESRGGKVLVIPDIPGHFPVSDTLPKLAPGFNIVMVTTFSRDEPIDQVIQAVERLHDVNVYLTGRPNRLVRERLKGLPPNVISTGFLPDPEFYALLRKADAVMALTTRPWTMQRGACEGLWSGRPLIVSNWQLLQEYFCEGAVWVENTAEDIQRGIGELRQAYLEYLSGIKNLQGLRKEDWSERRGQLVRLLDEEIGVR